MADFQTGLVEEICKRRDLRSRLEASIKKRVARVRRTIGGHAALPDEEVSDLLPSALGHAVYRALAERFMQDRSITYGWLLDKRREYARNGKDKTWDSEIVRQEFPEFADYLPKPGLTDDEILLWAARDFNELVAGSGTDYHQWNAINRVSVMGGRAARWSSYRRSGDRVDNSLAVHDNFELRELLEDPECPFGPGYDKALSVAISQFGTAGIFWMLNWLFFPNQYTKILNLLGYREEDVGYNEFQNKKQELLRKMPKVHERVMEILRNDPEMVHLYEMVRGFTPKEAAV